MRSGSMQVNNVWIRPPSTDIGLASLDLLELRFELQDRWKTRITNVEAIRLKTIGDVVNLVIERKQSQSP